jgi:hypothetical protein
LVAHEAEALTVVLFERTVTARYGKAFPSQSPLTTLGADF